MDKSGFKRKDSKMSNIAKSVLAMMLLIPLIWWIIKIIGNIF